MNILERKYAFQFKPICNSPDTKGKWSINNDENY